MSVSLTFRCPDDLAELIKYQVETTGKDKTSVLVGMLKQSLLALPLEERNNLPTTPAVYLVYQEDKLLYIGKTKNLKSRWLGHHRLVQFVEAGSGVYIAWFPCDEEQLEAMEDAFIELLDPELNGEPLLGTNQRSRVISFRFSHIEIQALSTLQKPDDKSLNQTAARLLRELLAGNNPDLSIAPAKSTVVNTESLKSELLAQIFPQVNQLLSEFREEILGK